MTDKIVNVRNSLPQRRHSETFTMVHGNHRTPFDITVGYYENGMVGEVFISGAQSGSEMEAITRDGAIVLSLALQHGVPIETLKRAITRNRENKPDTVIGAVIDRIAS